MYSSAQNRVFGSSPACFEAKVEWSSSNSLKFGKARTWSSQVLSTRLLVAPELLLYSTWVAFGVPSAYLFCTRVEPLLHLASRVQGSSPHFGPQPSAFLRGLAQHDPNGKRFYIQLVCRSYLSRMMVFHWLLLALLGSYLAAWQVGCTELSYFYSTRVVGSITWTLLE